jgi:spermidine/putrescine transport system substrate-binding protein
MIRHFVKRLWSYSLAIIAWVGMVLGVLYLPDLLLRPNQRVLHILTWGDILDPVYIRTFEQQTGIAVRLSYYASNEELQVKIKNSGKDYALVVPSDYAVGVLREQGLLKKLDKNRMPFLAQLNSRLLHHAYDPENDYSVPFTWELFGIGYDTNLFGAERINWDLIFKKPTFSYKVVMTNDPIEAIMSVACYLYGVQPITQLSELTTAQRAEIMQLLRAQNRWVEAYSSLRAGYYLATGTVPVAFTTTTAVFNAQKYAPKIAFSVPPEGGFITIENFVIPAGSEQEELAYQFMAFMYTQQSALHQIQMYGNLPAFLSDDLLAQVSPEIKCYLTMSTDAFKKIHFFKRLLPEAAVHELWVSVKA